MGDLKGCSEFRVSMIVVGIVTFLTLAACSSGANSQHEELTTASYETVIDVAKSTEYLVRAEVVGRPESSPSAADSLSYVVSRVKVLQVIAERPDAERPVDPGDIVRAGASLRAEVAPTSGDSGLPADYPAVDQALPEGATVLLFMVSATGSQETDFDLVGYATLAGDRAQLRALPGPIGGESYAEVELTVTFEDELRRPAPWRVAEDPSTTVVPEGERHPLSTEPGE